MKYVLDTNIAIAALNGIPSVHDRLTTIPGGDVGLSLVSIAELVYGAQRSKRRDENLARIQRLRHGITVLPLTDAVVERYGSVRATLEAKGINKSDFDLLIACTALDSGAVLVTNDSGLRDHSIEGLLVENWLRP